MQPHFESFELFEGKPQQNQVRLFYPFPSADWDEGPDTAWDVSTGGDKPPATTGVWWEAGLFCLLVTLERMRLSVIHKHFTKCALLYALRNTKKKKIPSRTKGIMRATARKKIGIYGNYSSAHSQTLSKDIQ